MILQIPRGDRLLALTDYSGNEYYKFSPFSY